MPTPTPPFATLLAATLLAAVLCAIAGYYVGKTSGLRTAERIHDLNKKDPVLEDNFAASGTDGVSTATRDKKGKGKAKVEEGDGEWESESDQGEDDGEDDDGGVNIKKFENSHEACKLVFVVRTDLGMTRGKIAAQCGHATIMCYKASRKHAPHLVRSWEEYGQAKIALQSKGGEDELLMLQAQAMSLGVTAKIVHDAGRTQIAAGSATVLGVGPAPVSVVNQITGHLKLL